MSDELKIKDLVLKSNIVLAPMAGYTDVGFRKLCAKFGSGITYTEMVSAKALLFDSEKTKELLLTEDDESYKAVQIFGHEPEVMAKACSNPLLQKFDLIDINMGCPAPKIVKNKEGSFLLTNKDLVFDIVSACRKATNKPLTVKMRLGYENQNVAVEIAKTIERAGADLITVHGRTQSQMYSGKVNIEEIRKVKEAVSIPVIANGDIVDFESLENMKNGTHCDGFMIGRGALGNPEIFAKLSNIDINLNKFDIIKEHIETLQKYFDERFIVLNMRKHIAYYLKNTGADKDLKQKLMLEENLENVLSLLKIFFNKK